MKTTIIPSEYRLTDNVEICQQYFSSSIISRNGKKINYYYNNNTQELIEENAQEPDVYKYRKVLFNKLLIDDAFIPLGVYKGIYGIFDQPNLYKITLDSDTYV